ncbi:MAG TPA: hypothetical protein VHX44_04550 [Planctomycetota bacterium]|nr:hypothetical protein [Planctomycetota bacterium]
MRRILAVLSLFLSLAAVAGANEGISTHSASIAPGAAVSALSTGATSTDAKAKKKHGKKGKHGHKKHHKHGKKKTK